jgi:hypothetical protein
MLGMAVFEWPCPVIVTLKQGSHCGLSYEETISEPNLTTRPGATTVADSRSGP